MNERKLLTRTLRGKILYQNLCSFTNEDALIWEDAVDDTDCQYTATHEGITYRINCDPLKRSFQMDEDYYALEEKDATALCRFITTQKKRLLINEAKLEAANRTFERRVS
jgi:hypothetical protein